jgi:hypothetical protein
VKTHFDKVFTGGEYEASKRRRECRVTCDEERPRKMVSSSSKTILSRKAPSNKGLLLSILLTSKENSILSPTLPKSEKQATRLPSVVGMLLLSLVLTMWRSRKR